MTHAINARYEDSQAHPHMPAGSPAGGQFAPKGGKGSGTTPKKPGPTRRRPPQQRDNGTLSYDPTSNRGTGYNSPNGDPRVHKLQQALNRLGLTDSAGKALKDDGKLGPKTTAAVRKAQHRLGLPADGKVTPALLEKLAGLKMLPARKAAPKKTVHAAAGPGEIEAAAVGSALLDVELARPGAWKLASGDVTFTDQMLQDAAAFFTASGGQAVPIKLGHQDDRFDGEPTFGSLTNVRYDIDDRGPVLIGDIVDMPGWLAAAAPKRWPNRSIEGWQNFTYDGREYSLVLSGLAFLGVTPPGVRNIKSLADLQVALAASSALRIVASAPPDDPAEPPDEPEAEAPPSAGLFAAQTAAASAEEPEEIGAGMNLAKYREALAGLPDDASEDDVKAALVAAGFTAESPPPELASEQTDGPIPVAAAGTVVLASSVWEETQKTIKSLTDHVAKTKRNERDEVIAKAVKAGKFTPAQKPHFTRLWDADPDGTRTLIDTLTPNSQLAVMASGYAGEPEDADAEYAALFGNVKVG